MACSCFSLNIFLLNMHAHPSVDTHKQVAEAAGGRPFNLAPPFPGAAALDEACGQTIEGAGAANAMLALSWRD